MGIFQYFSVRNYKNELYVLCSMNDYYAILGILVSATPKDIKKAFRRLAQRYHPDKNPKDTDAVQRFKDVVEAYEVLADPHRRKRYDRMIGQSAGEDVEEMRFSLDSQQSVRKNAVVYNNLYWEPLAYRSARFICNKKLFRVEESELRLKKRGYERHPYSHEVFSVVCDGLEGKLTDKISAIYHDMLYDMGEFFGDYVNVRGGIVFWQRGDEGKEFRFNEQIAGEERRVADCPDDFVMHVYGRPFARLPRQIQRVDIHFPLEGSHGVPIGLSKGVYSRFDIKPLDNLYHASRGVVSIKRICDRNEK